MARMSVSAWSTSKANVPSGLAASSDLRRTSRSLATRPSQSISSACARPPSRSSANGSKVTG